MIGEAVKQMEGIFNVAGKWASIGGIALIVLLFGFRAIINHTRLLSELNAAATERVVTKMIHWIGALVFFSIVAYVAALVIGAQANAGTKPVTVMLINGTARVNEHFRIFYTLPGQGELALDDKDFKATVLGVPMNAKTLNVTAAGCDGYEVGKDGPYAIDENDVVRIPMVKVDKKGAPEDLPDVAKVAAPLMPPEDEVMQREANYRTNFLLTVKNLTGEQLTLALYNGYAYYHHDGPQPPQTVFSAQVDAGKQTQRFPRLIKVSTGICVPCIIASDRQVYPFSAQDFYANPSPLLTFTRTGDADKPYALEFGEAPDD